MRSISIVLGIASALLVSAASAAAPPRPAYRLTLLPLLDGATSRGTSINDWGLVAGSSVFGDGRRHATVWLDGRAWDLGTLGAASGLSSAVIWPVKNHLGFVSGISHIDAVDLNREGWSCGFFLANPGHHVCQGFVWAWGTMRALPSLGTGDHNTFATGTNDLGRTVGWAENDFRDPACDPDSGQQLQFKPVVWDWGRAAPQELPLLDGDTSGAATALNNRGQVVGISGACDQAVGRYTARHAVRWERDGSVTELRNPNGAGYWNTPYMINERGDVVGFAGVPGDVGGNSTQPFLWTRQNGFQFLPLLAGDAGGSAQSIDARGRIVGYSGARAVLWASGSAAPVDLNTQVAPMQGVTLVAANDINYRGEIAGTAITPGGRMAFTATPVGH